MPDGDVLSVGEVVNGRYEVMEWLGADDPFETFKARDRIQNRIVTLKLLRESLAAFPDASGRLVSEGSSALDLVHPNIARVYEADRLPETAFLATEFVHGMTLKERIRRTAPLPLAVAIDIGIAIADALGFAHSQGVVHGDLRSQNVLITAEGQVKVTDFGVRPALAFAAPDPTLDAMPYLAPEVVAGQPATPQSDLYSLGAVLYEMITGAVPFEGNSVTAIALKLARDPPVAPSHLNAGVPPALDGVVLKALHKDPARRYRSVELLLKDLHSAQDGLRFGRSLNWSPSEARAPSAPVAEVEEVPPAASAISTLNRILLLIVLLGIGTVVLLAWMLLFRSNRDVRVPSLIGLPRSVALEKIAPIGLVPHVITEWNDQVNPDTVYKTYPAAGAAVKRGNDLSLWVSKGPEQVTVPDVTRVKSSRALDLLRDAGLKPGHVSEEYNPDIAKGMIVSQSPEAGRQVAPKSAVDLVKSLGSEPEPPNPEPPAGASPTEPVAPQAPVPEATGSTAGSSPSPSPSQSTPAPPEPAPPAATTGATPSVPPVEAPPRAAPTPAAPTPAARGPRRRFQVNVDVPDGPDLQSIRIDVVDSTGTHTRYTGRHHPHESLSRIVSGVGDDITLRVYSDGTLIDETRPSRGGSTP